MPSAGVNTIAQSLTRLNLTVQVHRRFFMIENNIGLTVRAAAERIGVSESFVRLEIRRGNLKAKKFGTRVSIPVESLNDYYRELPAWKPGEAPVKANEARRQK